MVTPWTKISTVVSGWGRASNERAIAIAREASVECSRMAVERAEVAIYLTGRAERASYAAAT